MRERKYDDAGLTPKERFQERQSLETKELLIELRSLLDSEQSKDSEFRSRYYKEALNYLNRFWKEIFAYLDDGELPIDNTNKSKPVGSPCCGPGSLPWTAGRICSLAPTGPLSIWPNMWTSSVCWSPRPAGSKSSFTMQTVSTSWGCEPGWDVRRTSPLKCQGSLPAGRLPFRPGTSGSCFSGAVSMHNQCATNTDSHRMLKAFACLLFTQQTCRTLASMS